MVELDILEKVLLLAILKRGGDETMSDILKKLVNSGAFHSLKEAKDSLRALKERKYILSSGEISMVGCHWRLRKG